MAALSSTNKLYVTSCACGPAFEGYGIEMGMKAVEGAVVKVEAKNGNYFDCKTVGNTKALGIAGSGLLSAVNAFLENGIINQNGSFSADEKAEKKYLTPEVYLTQKDIRNFQLAKGALYSGLKVLNSLCDEDFRNSSSFLSSVDCKSVDVASDDVVQGDVVPDDVVQGDFKTCAVLSETENALTEKVLPLKNRKYLYLAGGFGTKLNIQEAENVRLFPEELCKNVVQCGNAAVTGAVMLALNRKYRILSEKLCSKAKVINLAEMENFQPLYISSLNF